MKKTKCAIKNHPHYVYCGDCDPDNIYNRKGDQNNMKKNEKEAVLEALFWALEYLENEPTGELGNEESFGLKLINKAIKAVKL